MVQRETLHRGDLNTYCREFSTAHTVLEYYRLLNKNNLIEK